MITFRQPTQGYHALPSTNVGWKKAGRCSHLPGAAATKAEYINAVSMVAPPGLLHYHIAKTPWSCFCFVWWRVRRLRLHSKRTCALWFREYYDTTRPCKPTKTCTVGCTHSVYLSFFFQKKQKTKDFLFKRLQVDTASHAVRTTYSYRNRETTLSIQHFQCCRTGFSPIIRPAHAPRRDTEGHLPPVVCTCLPIQGRSPAQAVDLYNKTKKHRNARGGVGVDGCFARSILCIA